MADNKKVDNKKDIKNRNVEELKGLLKEAKDALFNFRLEKAQNKLKNTSAISLKRKEIARVLTSIREKELNNE